MKNNILYALTIVLVLMTSSCDVDEFLDKVPQGTLTEDQILENEDALNALVTATYSMLNGLTAKSGSRYEYSASSTNTTFGDLPSDDATKGGGGLGDQGGMHQIEMMLTEAGNGDVAQKWQGLYEGLNRANRAIRVLKEATILSETLKNQRIAEVRLLRGFFYFELKKIFGNIVCLDEELNQTYDQLEGITNDCSGETLFGIIEADFKFAEDHLRPPADETDLGRVNLGVAYACLAKLYMYWKKWPEVITYCDKVESLGYYQLTDNYNDNFDASKDNTTREAIFQIQHTLEGGSQYAANISDRLIRYGGTYGNLDFLHPSRNIVNSYATDAVTGLPLNNINISEDISKTLPVDPRLDFSIYRDGADVHGDHIYDPLTSRGVGLYPPYGCKKKVAALEYFDLNYPNGNALNFHLIRYAEVLLMKAEALVESGGDLTMATDLVNRLRTRAKNSPSTLDSGGAPFANYIVEPYPSDFADAAEATEKIRLERRLELAFEGHRFFDLVRWGIAEEVLNAYFIEVKGTEINYLESASFQSNKNEIFPIPRSEVDLLNLSQNPNY